MPASTSTRPTKMVSNSNTTRNYIYINNNTIKIKLFTSTLVILLLSILVQHSSQQAQPAADDTDTDSLKQSQAAPDSRKARQDYVSPQLERYHLFEHFDDSLKFDSRWIKSQDPKYKGKWELNSSETLPQADLQLVLASKANHHAIATKLDKPFVFATEKQLQKPLIVQYEVEFRDGLDCGGAYLKMLRQPSNDLSQVNDKTPYSIMFGPDKCGSDNKVHFIVNYLNPITKQYEEKHWKSSKQNSIITIFSDKKTHFFRLVLQPNDQFEIFVDDKPFATGSLLTDMEPAINPPKEVVDEKDKKPADWDERARIEDPEATKPDDWDEEAPRTIPDSAATKPTDWLENEPETVPEAGATKPKDWDHEMDGEWDPPQVDNPVCKTVSGCGKWTAPMVDNPNYKGKWRAPMIDNPNYKGVWSPRLIPNPEYYHDENPFASLNPIDAVAFELWSMSEMIAFDNILVTDDLDTATLLQRMTWETKKIEADASSPSIITKLLAYTKEYPIGVWIVVALAIGLTLCLFIAFCCTGNKSRSENAERIAANKKADISAPDAEPSEQVNEVSEDDEDEAESLIADEEELVDNSEEDDDYGDEDNDNEKEFASEEDSQKVAGDEMKSREPAKRQTRRSKRN